MSGDTEGGRPGPKESSKRQRPLKRARVGWPPALRQLKELLYEGYLAAGAPSLDEIAGDIADDDGLPGSPSRDTVHRVITDGERPGGQADVVAVATVLARRAAWDAPDLAVRVRELWVQAGMAKGAGRTVGDLRGDVQLVLDGGLGVHPALDTGGARDRFGILPAYTPRDHDARLKAVVDAAKAGRSGIAVLVGGSSTGKTRALWEAVGELPDGWRLWHPLSPTAPDAVLAALADIAPKTVVWLNEAQHYLDNPLGERVAAGLRELLNDPLRAPVLVLGTLWPEHWNTLTIRATPDRHAGARELLNGHKIDVPDAFTPAGLAALDANDPRLAQAAQHAKGAQITQYLAGVPYLMDRYKAARGATLALIHAAMDARRLGAGLHLPLDWLAGAAPGYLDDDEYHTLNRNWLTQALDYVTTPCNGIPGILTLVTTSSPRNQRSRCQPVTSSTPVLSLQGPRYLLANYLEQQGRRDRAETIPPIDFWTAAAHHAHPTDLTALGDAAWDRGLYRDAAQLHKHATTHGDPDAAIAIVRNFRTLHPSDHHPAQWAAAHVSLEDPGAVGKLLRELRKAGEDGQFIALLARDPVAHAALNNPDGIGSLLWVLKEARADDHVTALAERAVVHVAVDDPYAVGGLLKELREAGEDWQFAAVAARAVAHADLDDTLVVAWLLDALREVGADGHVAALLARDPVAHVALNDPFAVGVLLQMLREAGENGHVTALLARDPVAHAALNNLDGVRRLLYELRDAGAHGHVTALAERATTHVALDSPGVIGGLLRMLREAGEDGQFSALLARDPVTHVALNDPAGIGGLLRMLREAGEDGHISALLARDPVTHVALNDPYGVGGLWEELQKVGAHGHVTALAERATTHVALNDPGAIASLMRLLRTAAADGQVTALAKRAATHATLNFPMGVRWLLEELQDSGEARHAAILTERLPAAGHFDLFVSLRGNREKFRFGREPDGSATPSWTWDDVDSTTQPPESDGQVPGIADLPETPAR